MSEDVEPLSDAEIVGLASRVASERATDSLGINDFGWRDVLRLLVTLKAERERREAAEKRATLLMAALRRECRCEDRHTGPLPADWGTNWTVRIPHHCDCPLYPFELPDPQRAPSAYADAIKQFNAIVQPEPVAGEETGDND